MLQIDYWYFLRKNIFVASAVLASFTAVLLQTEREGRAGEYWPEIMAEPSAHKNDRRSIFPSTTRAS